MKLRKNIARHVIRGGSYGSVARNLRVTYRFRYRPEDRVRSVGFHFVIRGKP